MGFLNLIINRRSTIIAINTAIETAQLVDIVMWPSPTSKISEGIEPMPVIRIYLKYFMFIEAAKKQIIP